MAAFRRGQGDPGTGRVSDGGGRMGRPWVFAAVALASFLSAAPLWAGQHALKSKARNYPNTPVTLEQSKVTLVETFATPLQAGIPGTSQSRIRDANHPGGLLPAAVMLSGEALCVNRSAQAIEAIKLSVVFLDAFHQAIELPGQRGAYVVKQIVESVPRKSSKVIAWEQRVETSEIYEVAVVVTGVRFSDGSVWLAPDIELIDIL